MNEQMQKSLIKVAKVLNEAEVQWAVGASLMLHTLGITKEVHDIDIFIVWEDIDKAINAIDSIARQIPTFYKDEYDTKYFQTFHVDSIGLDVMSRFRIKHSEGIYEFPLKEENIVRIDWIDGVKIPYTAPEDWFVAYMLMINREPKVKMIEAYLAEEGVKYPKLLKCALKQELPKNVKKEISKYL